VLRPEKGEGERRNNSFKKTIKKGPLILSTALFFAMPICMAESATAQVTSSFGQVLPQSRLETTTAKHLGNLPRNYLSQRLQSSSLPSLDEINTLESTLSSYKTQLATLKSNALKYPTKDVSAQVSSLTSKIADYEGKVATAKADYSKFLLAQATLRTALERYDNATLEEQTLQTTKDSAQLTLNEAQAALSNQQEAVQSAQDAFDAATRAHNSATQTFSQADASLTQQKESKAQARLTLNRSQDAADEAASRLEAAQQTFNEASSNLSQKTGDLQSTTSELATANLTLEASVRNFDAVQASSNQASLEVTAALTTLDSAIYNAARKQASLLGLQNTYNETLNLKNTAEAQLPQAQQEYDQTVTDSEAAWGQFWTANSELGTKTSDLQYAQQNYDSADTAFQQALTSYNIALDNYTSTYQDYLASQQTFNEASSNLSSAQADLNSAQSNYDNNLITDPNSTGQVSQPGLTVKVYNNLNSSNPQRSDTTYNLCLTTTLTNIEGYWGGGNILGCGSDRVMIHYTGYLTPTENVTYLMNQADDGFYMDLNGSNVINNWYLKGCGGNWNSVQLQAGQSYAIDAWFYEWGGGACSTLYYQSNNNWGVVPAAWYSQNEPARMIKNPELLPALQEAQSNYDAALAEYNQVSSEWGIAQANQQSAAQQSTNWYYEVIGTAQLRNSTYDGLITSQNNYNVALTTRDSVWSQVGTLEQLKNSRSAAVQTLNEQVGTYTNQLAQLDSQVVQAILDLADANGAVATAQDNLSQVQTSNEDVLAELAAAQALLSSAQSSYDEALANREAAQGSYESAVLTNNEADSALTTASADKISTSTTLRNATVIYNTESTKSQEAQTTFNESVKSLTAAEGSKTAANSALVQASSELLTKQITEATASSDLQVAITSHEQSVIASAAALSSKTSAEQELSSAQTLNEESIQTAKEATGSISETFNEATSKLNEPNPVPEEGSKEIPAELTAENLLSVDLDAVDPTELTEAQAEQLVAAALETFETAEVGSPEYAQALDALYLAAEQDDIELSPELAAIPGLAAAAELINFFGNAGSDMSPKVREESKKVVVATVVATGAAIQAAAGAAAGAAASSASSSSSGSGSSRRK
jgi:hypothetical protein